MTLRAPYVLATLLVLGAATGCGIEVPGDPTWTEDVRPILAANCIRCHSVPATGGAPDSFRLDSYEDTFGIDGRQVRGAASMARFIAVRAGEMGEMPPDFPRTDGQRDILINWWARTEELGGVPVCQGRDDLGFRFCPELGQTRPSRAPDAIALELPATADGDPVTIRYEISDADGDLVNGALIVGGVLVSTDLRDGRGEVTFDPSSLPIGPNTVIAELTDDIDTVSINLGTIDVDHASGNTAPRVRITAPARYTLISDATPDLEISVTVTDIDPGTPPMLDLIAFRGTEERVIAEDVPIIDGVAIYDWDDTTPLAPAGTHSNWRLRAVVPDGPVTGIGETDVFVVSNESTMLTYADVSGIISSYCSDCHGSVMEVPNTFEPHGNALGSAGLMYRRLVQQETMPPPSAPGVIDGYTPLPDADRATLAEYLLGGAPP